MSKAMTPKTLAMLLVAAFLGGFAAYVISVVKHAEPAPIEVLDLYKGIPRDEKLLHLDKQALDAAYQAQLQLLFSVWLKDGAATDATRITNGLRNARRAYHQAAEQIAKREQELQK